MQWQRSPQYKDMPHAEYMQTEEGKQSQKAFTDWGNWMRGGTTQAAGLPPVQGGATTSMPTAQPPAAPSSSPGNPYGFTQGQGASALDMTRYTPTAEAATNYATRTSAAPAQMSMYSPGRAQPVQAQSQGTPYGQQATVAQQPSLANQNPYATTQPGAYYQGQYFGGDTATAISQAQRQRDATVMQALQATMPYTLANVFGQDLGAPNYDFQGMIGKANQMVQDGFYNPFTQYFEQQAAPLNSPSQYAPPSLYSPYGMTQQMAAPTQPQSPAAPARTAVQDLFARNNIQAPPGFLDQLISLLGGSAPRPQMPQMLQSAGPPSPAAASAAPYSPQVNPTTLPQHAQDELARRDSQLAASDNAAVERLDPMYRDSARAQISRARDEERDVMARMYADREKRNEKERVFNGLRAAGVPSHEISPLMDFAPGAGQALLAEATAWANSVRQEAAKYGEQQGSFFDRRFRESDEDYASRVAGVGETRDAYNIRTGRGGSPIAATPFSQNTPRSQQELADMVRDIQQSRTQATRDAALSRAKAARQAQQLEDERRHRAAMATVPRQVFAS